MDSSGSGERQLQTRVRELRFLLRLTSLINDRELPLDLLLKRLVALLPQAYQYPELACVRVECDGRTVQSPNFRNTAWEQSADIGTLVNRSGRLTVSYLEPGRTRPRALPGGGARAAQHRRELLASAWSGRGCAGC